MQHDYFRLLITSAQGGRKNAFIDLCELSAKKIYTLAVRMLVDPNVAKIVTVDIFIQAWENIKFVREDTPFDIWLKGIAIYTILDEIRTKSRRETLKKSKTPGHESFDVDDKLESMILALPEKERVIFILHEIEGYTYQEISDFLHEYKLNEIKFIIRETRQKLVEALDDEL